jgi:hypothetical protein
MTRRPTRSAQIEMTKTVEAYLAYVNNRQQGRPRSPEWYAGRIAEIRKQMSNGEVSFVKKLRLMQQIKNHEASMAEAEDPTEEFVKIAIAYSELHGIEYDTWRELGVPARVLKEAGWQ